MNTKHLSAFDWSNHIKLMHTRPPVKIKSVIRFNQETVEVFNLKSLTIRLHNWFDEGTSENHSSIQFGYVSDSESNEQRLFYLSIPKTGTTIGSYDLLTSNIQQILNISDYLLEKFNLTPSIQSGNHLIILDIVTNSDDHTVRIFDFIQIATPILTQLGLFDGQ